MSGKHVSVFGSQDGGQSLLRGLLRGHPSRHPSRRIASFAHTQRLVPEHSIAQHARLCVNKEEVLSSNVVQEGQLVCFQTRGSIDQELMDKETEGKHVVTLRHYEDLLGSPLYQEYGRNPENYAELLKLADSFLRSNWLTLYMNIKFWRFVQELQTEHGHLARSHHLLGILFGKLRMNRRMYMHYGIAMALNPHTICGQRDLLEACSRHLNRHAIRGMLMCMASVARVEPDTAEELESEVNRFPSSEDRVKRQDAR